MGRCTWQAEKRYGKLVEAALPLLKREGVLFASTKAAKLEPEKFLGAIGEAVTKSGRKIFQQHYVPQPPDFPISRAEPAYLKTVWRSGVAAGHFACADVWPRYTFRRFRHCGPRRETFMNEENGGANHGDGGGETPVAAQQFLPVVYGELRRLAAFKMAQEAPGQTFQPTELVHEAWLRLSGDNGPLFHDRAHFFRVAAEAMRRILIDRARRRQRVRHGGGQERTELDELEIASPESDERLLQVHDIMDRFAEEHPDKAEVVKLRFFVGLSDVEMAGVLGISERTVERHWAYAKVWLLRAAREGP